MEIRPFQPGVKAMNPLRMRKGAINWHLERWTNGTKRGYVIDVEKHGAGISNDNLVSRHSTIQLQDSQK